jgi:hypothetical protein
MTRTDLIQKLSADLAVDEEPTLSPGDLESLADQAKRWDTWTANTAVGIGARYVPAVWNGRVYTVVTAGTTGAEAKRLNRVFAV